MPAPHQKKDVRTRKSGKDVVIRISTLKYQVLENKKSALFRERPFASFPEHTRCALI